MPENRREFFSWLDFASIWQCVKISTFPITQAIMEMTLHACVPKVIWKHDMKPSSFCWFSTSSSEFHIGNISRKTWSVQNVDQKNWYLDFLFPQDMLCVMFCVCFEPVSLLAMYEAAHARPQNIARKWGGGVPRANVRDKATKSTANTFGITISVNSWLKTCDL